MAMKYLVRLGDDEASYEVEAADGQFRVRRDEGEWRTCELARVGDADLYLLMLDNQPTELYPRAGAVGRPSRSAATRSTAMLARGGPPGSAERRAAQRPVWRASTPR